MDQNEWVPCEQFFDAIKADYGTDRARDLILENAQSGFLQARARVAICLSLDGRRQSERDWIIPVDAWRPVSSHNHYFDPANGSLWGEGFPPEAMGFQVARADILQVATGRIDLQRIEFRRSDLEYLGFQFESSKTSELPPRPAPLLAAERSNRGAKVRAEDWAKFSAALAVLFDRGEVDLDNVSETHAKVAAYLSERGHDEALSAETVKSLIRRLNAWSKDRDFADDARA